LVLVVLRRLTEATVFLVLSLQLLVEQVGPQRRLLDKQVVLVVAVTVVICYLVPFMLVVQELLVKVLMVVQETKTQRSRAVAVVEQVLLV
jgi:hypothetical protein